MKLVKFFVFLVIAWQSYETSHERRITQTPGQPTIHITIASSCLIHCTSDAKDEELNESRSCKEINSQDRTSLHHTIMRSVFRYTVRSKSSFAHVPFFVMYHRLVV